MATPLSRKRKFEIKKSSLPWLPGKKAEQHSALHLLERTTPQPPDGCRYGAEAGRGATTASTRKRLSRLRIAIRKVQKPPLRGAAGPGTEPAPGAWWKKGTT